MEISAPKEQSCLITLELMYVFSEAEGMKTVSVLLLSLCVTEDAAQKSVTTTTEFSEQKDTWKELQDNAIGMHYGWEESAAKYREHYASLL